MLHFNKKIINVRTTKKENPNNLENKSANKHLAHLYRAGGLCLRSSGEVGFESTFETDCKLYAHLGGREKFCIFFKVVFRFG